ncbi:TetR/AcrR family transcriptional regulator [Vibrio fluvialis]|uniref:TetR/AcrR family transcriptional regulator n=1 Tax=Vibrio fluvialis TaxID=676 RepID=UPI001302564A|nr:TetR/AcrR family transcriptional regulator [Vibrio fluvialis]MBY7946334.1 TetR/AcrR family transcriptional regulator [Vibrio fluvialis]MBY8173175.1 TetR/AcrR family transcriptional regulator [Vibrio fluvialis]MBY8237532.1 TetR/AcrR family transcriptional regulator [Vibrio fluvialis]MBY8241890.1 TetR/AcrR family transcriptional regulator [Vibrio fluvialis]MCG6341979.1 TetR/AcrR family transcriptional regulator [Vibrio fluvialis]
MPDQQADKRLAIIESAETLIAELGFRGLSMHKLAQKAGVAAGTLYRYFDDKEHLLLEVRLHVSRRIAEAVQANVSDDMPLKQRFRTMWLNIWSLASSDGDLICNRLQYESLPTTTGCNTRELERKMFTKVDLLFDQGKNQGLFKPLDNQILAALSFETTVVLAQKNVSGLYQLDNDQLQAVIEASWDAIIQH